MCVLFVSRDAQSLRSPMRDSRSMIFLSYIQNVEPIVAKYRIDCSFHWFVTNRESMKNVKNCLSDIFYWPDMCPVWTCVSYQPDVCKPKLLSSKCVSYCQYWLHIDQISHLLAKNVSYRAGLIPICSILAIQGTCQTGMSTIGKISTT